MCNPLDNLHLLPPALAFFLVSACVSSYVIAVSLQHVPPVFPYISEAGSKAPESCIFSQLLGMASIVAGLVMYFEFRFLTLHIPQTQRLNWRVNQFALAVGMLSCLGANVVANFQLSNIVYVHLIAAAVLFLGVTLYSVLITFLTIRLRSVLCCPLALCVFRFVFSSLGVVFMFVCVISGIVARMQNKDLSKWEKSGLSGRRPRFPFQENNLYLISTFTEWIVVFLMMIFFFSLMPDLRRVRARWMSVELKRVPEANGELTELRSGAVDIA